MRIVRTERALSCQFWRIAFSNSEDEIHHAKEKGIWCHSLKVLKKNETTCNYYSQSYGQDFRLVDGTTSNGFDFGFVQIKRYTESKFKSANKSSASPSKQKDSKAFRATLYIHATLSLLYFLL